MSTDTTLPALPKQRSEAKRRRTREWLDSIDRRAELLPPEAQRARGRFFAAAWIYRRDRESGVGDNRANIAALLAAAEALRPAGNPPPSPKAPTVSLTTRGLLYSAACAQRAPAAERKELAAGVLRAARERAREFYATPGR